MIDRPEFNLTGVGVAPAPPDRIDVINPATEEPCARISSGIEADVDRAVAAACNAFPAYSAWSVAERVELLESLREEYKKRWEDIAVAISTEMGAPIDMSRSSQTALGAAHIKSAINALAGFDFERSVDGMLLRYEPIGVCAMITPWNWPMNQVAAKVAPALAAGCSMVLKPSEESPLSANLFAEVVHAAGVPAGVFNMIHGYGATVGAALAAHIDVDMVSFTGSTRGGIAVAHAAADTVKRVTQELGGKSANIILDDCDIAAAVAEGVTYCMDNSGQSCNAPTRMLVPERHMDAAIEAARSTAGAITVDDPSLPGGHLGPVVNRSQFDRIQKLIQRGIDEGAELVVGGTGRPAGVQRGYYVKPTVFARVDNNMTIAREEIFGPVICLIGYRDDDHAIAIANDTDYGLAGYVSSANPERATAVARRIRAGQIAINYVSGNADTPFGGYKQSGNGREKGRWGLAEHLELKAITGIG